MIAQETIDQILSRTDIVEVARREGLPLKRAGADWVCCCPMHGERTPSFHISPARQTWHCFGQCQAGGNALTLLMRLRGMTFPEAVRELGREAGVEVEERRETAEEIQRRMRREALMVAAEQSMDYFRRMIHSPLGRRALEYATRRFGSEAVESFGLGWAPAELKPDEPQGERTETKNTPAGETADGKGTATNPGGTAAPAGETADGKGTATNPGGTAAPAVLSPAPAASLAAWAAGRGLSAALLSELGLVRRGRDVLRDRLVFPIRDRAGRTIGYTARDLSGDGRAPKYLNSPESELYHKRSSVWGIDTAARWAAREGTFYLVEGAADALRLQSLGIAGAVAPLGGAWTRDQLAALRHMAPAVCFINDADPPGAGEPYGAGVAYVLKNGETALAAGLSVNVRELPLAADGGKQDPGSYFRSADDLSGLAERDFILFAATKLYRPEGSTESQAAAIRRLAELLSYVTDEVRLGIIVPQLTRLTRGKKEMYLSLARRFRFEREAERSRSQRQTERQSASRAAEAEGADAATAADGGGGAAASAAEADELPDNGELQEYGFYFDPRPSTFGYWSTTDKGNDMQWTNFVMRPLFHVRDEERPKRLFRITNDRRRSDILELTMEDLNSCPKFRQRIEGVGNYLFMATDREMIRLKRYLYDNTETAQLVKQLGWQGRGGFYAWGNGLYRDGSFHKADRYGIVRLPDGGGNYYIPAASQLYAGDTLSYERERRFVHLDLQRIDAADYFRRFAEVYGDNGRVALMYWAAALFRDIVVALTDKFPLLNLFGPKGSGKSQMAAALMAFFVTDYKAPNIQSATPAALSYEVAATSNALCHIDEYKNDIDARRIDFLKGLYDGAGRMKMGGASYDKVEMTSVKTGVILSGQELPTADIALFHRCVYLSFPRSTFSPDEKRRFERLRAVQRLGLTSITLRVLDERRLFEARFADSYQAATEALTRRLSGGPQVETRLLENWAKVLGAYHALRDRLPWPMTFDEMADKSALLLAGQNKMSGEGNELGRFFDTLQYLHDTGDLYEEGDYLIRERSDIKTAEMERTFATPRQLLYLNTSRVFQLYRVSMLRSGSKPLPEDALREYLKNAPYYLGRKSAGFRVIIDGVERTVKDPAPGQTNRLISSRRALVFDYGEITRLYGISLETEAEQLPESQAAPF